MKTAGLLGVALFWSLTIAGQAGVSVFDQARAHYDKGEFREAIAAYESLLPEGGKSPVLHYNLGNAWFRTGDLGKAILHYERGLKYAPGDEDLRFNLSVARAQQVDQIEALPPFLLLRWWTGLRNLLAANTWTWLGILLFWTAAAGVGVWGLAGVRAWRKRGFWTAVILFPLAFLVFALAFNRKAFELHSGQAIVIVGETDLRIAPDPESRAVRPLHAGAKTWLEDQIGEWYKVRLENGEVGWIEVGEVAEI